MAKTDQQKEQEQPSAQKGNAEEGQPSDADRQQARHESENAVPHDESGQDQGETEGLGGQPLFGSSTLFQTNTLYGSFPSGNPFYGEETISSNPVVGIGQSLDVAEGVHPLQLIAPAPSPKSNTTLYEPDDSDSGVNLFASLYSEQWAYNNTDYPGVDLNILTAWEEFTGKGVLVGLIDDGVEYTHPDLIDNYDPAYGYDAKLKVNDPSPKSPDEGHGTNCASLVAAPDNGIGIVGVAHEASFGFSRIDLVDQSTWDADVADAASHLADADVVSMSYGGTGFVRSDLEKKAYQDLAANGREGLGTAMFQAVGNGRSLNEMGTYEDLSSLPYVSQIAGIAPSGVYAYFSTPSPTVLVSAPGDDIWVADRLPPNGYNPDGAYDYYGGTSYSAPMVAGVAALMIEANPNIGYRDIQSILAMTARKTTNAFNDPDQPWTWQVNGADNWNGGGIHVSHDYGFGLADVTAAVRLAESWDQGAHTAANVDTASGSATLGTVFDNGSVSSTVTIGSAIDVEYAVVEATIAGGAPSQLVATLTSPQGTTSWLLNNPPDQWDADFTYTFDTSDTYAMGSTQCRGEEGMGNWTFTVSDTEAGTAHTLESWSITLHGETGDVDDLYVFTDEYSEMADQDGARSALNDAAGTDTINAAAVSSASRIDLRDGATSLIDDAALEIAGGTVIENAHSGDGDDTLIGNAADNQLFGWRGNDTLSGNLGADILTGGSGNDTLSGGDGADLYHYASPGHGGDTVTDFSRADDGFSFDYEGFGQSGTGTLSESRFFTDDAAVDVADASFVYEESVLWYDSDGAGDADKIRIAEVSGDYVQADDIVFV